MTPGAIDALVARVADDRGPIHIHVAEQRREVDECVRLTGRRPLEWLLAHVPLDARWHLVHATHVSADEIAGVARRGCGVVLCPTTEANLGDGITDLPGWLAAGVPLSIGSDSQVTLDWREELRLLEYGQRLVHERRNVAADATRSSAARLVELAIAAGGSAAGFRRWGLVAGARADFVVVDDTDLPAGAPSARRLLDTLVFVSPSPPFRDVAVAGRWVLRDGHPAGTDRPV